MVSFYIYHYLTYYAFTDLSYLLSVLCLKCCLHKDRRFFLFHSLPHPPSLELCLAHFMCSVNMCSVNDYNLEMLYCVCEQRKKKLLIIKDEVVKNQPAIARDAREGSLIPVLGRSPGVGNGNPLQYSCLENSIYRGAWRAPVYGFAESDVTKQTLTHMHTHTVVLQYCISFRWTEKWFSYTCIDTYMFIYKSILVQIIFHYRLLQNIEHSSLCYTICPYHLPIP